MTFSDPAKPATGASQTRTDTSPGVTPSRRVLVLAYYFPPLGGSGVQRVAALVRYLPAFGWNPTVVTAQPGRYFAFDEGLADDVRRAGVRVVSTRTLDPTRWGEGRAAMPAGRRAERLSALSAWAFVPDNKIGWLPFALAASAQEHRKAPFDAVLATAPPYTSLLAGARVARRWGVPFAADLRDDWLGNPRHRYPTRLHRHLHTVLERRALGTASAIFVISDSMRDAVVERHPDFAHRVCVVPQGFDPADFPRTHPHPKGDAAPPSFRATGDPFRIVYAGVFYDAQRPDTFLAALARFAAMRPEARIAADFYGLVPPDFDALVAGHGLGSAVTYHGYKPHREIAQRLSQAALLWMTIGERPGAEGISTGKLFEYIGTRRPILGLVPLRGTAAEALRTYGAAWVVAPGDVDGAAQAIDEAWRAWRQDMRMEASEAFVQRHDRRRIAGEVAAYLNAAAR